VLEAATGDFYVADRIEEPKKEEELTRIQKFNGEGKVLAEKVINLPNAHELELRAIALDAEKKTLYVLVEGAREGTKFDNEKDAAVAILAFSTEVHSETLEELKPLVEKKALEPYSDKPKLSLIEPAAIAVNPKTHEVLISAQQDEDNEAKRQLRAVIQPVLENGTLGPRYVDSKDCLDRGEEVAEEPACEELSHGEQPVSLVVTQGGRALVEMEQEQLWEIPTPGGSKEVPVVPRRRFLLPSVAPTENEVVKDFSGEEEQSDTIAYSPVGAEEGTIYAGVELSPSKEAFTSGVMLLKVNEHAGGLTISEMGWTGGAGATSNQQKCKLPSSNEMPLEVAGSAEQVDVFTGIESLEGGQIVSEPVIDKFGSSAGAEACGHVEVTTPTIKIGAAENVQEVNAGSAAKATLSSKLEGADALESSWQIVRRVGGKVEHEETLTSTVAEYLGKEAAVKYTFVLPGEYEIIETVTTDNLATPTKQVVRKVKAVVPPITFKIEPASQIPSEGFPKGSQVKLRAKLADPNETEPRLKLTWHFGDGTTVEQHATGAAGAYTAEVEHTFNSTCGGVCTVSLEAKDEAGGEGTAQTGIRISNKVEEEAQKKAKEVEEQKKKAEEEAAAKKKAEEEERKKKEGEGKTEVLHEVTVHDPEAKIAGSTSLSVGAGGAVTLQVSCPAKESECVGTVTLQAVVARSAKKGGKPKKVTITLARGSFSVAGGASKALTLHISAQGRALLAHGRTLHASAVVLAHDSANVTRQTTAGVTLRLAAKKGAKKH